MRINRAIHPFASKNELEEFVRDLKPIELDILTEVVSDEYEKNNLVAKEAYRKIEQMKTAAESIKVTLRRAQQELEELDEQSEKLATLLSGKETKKDGNT